MCPPPQRARLAEHPSFMRQAATRAVLKAESWLMRLSCAGHESSDGGCWLRSSPCLSDRPAIGRDVFLHGGT